MTVRAATNKKSSTLIRPIARYVQSGELNFECEEPDEVIAALVEEYGTNAKVDKLDGITIDAFSRRCWWFNVRKSNTEPLLRLNAEGRTEQQLSKLLDGLSPKLGVRVTH